MFVVVSVVHKYKNDLFKYTFKQMNSSAIIDTILHCRNLTDILQSLHRSSRMTHGKKCRLLKTTCVQSCMQTEQIFQRTRS